MPTNSAEVAGDLAAKCWRTGAALISVRTACHTERRASRQGDVRSRLTLCIRSRGMSRATRVLG